MKYTDQFDGLFKHYLGEWWLWGKAIAIVESNLNPWAIGDGGKAIGLLQQHPEFWSDYGSAIIRAPWHPTDQVAALRKFWEMHADKTPQERVLIYHYGATGAAEHPDDPDRYWMRVLNALGTLGSET